MNVLDINGAAAFLGVSTKTARELIPRLPHGDVSRSAGPNHKYVIAQETLEAFVRGEIQPEPVRREANVVELARRPHKRPRFIPGNNGPIPRRAPSQPSLMSCERRAKHESL